MSKHVPTLYGDLSLGQQLQQAVLDAGHQQQGACIALVDPQLPQGSLIPGVDADPSHTFHLGSIGKALNGLIYSALVGSGVITGRDPLGKFLPLGDAPAGEVTLESLVTHTSGLPRIAGGWRASFCRGYGFAAEGAAQ